jgi:SpoVK/Ycf46/Vps4 family AAA+-type ATPase
LDLRRLSRKTIHLVKRLEGQQKTAKLKDIKRKKPTLHMMFTGPPGTGKTEVARIMKEILYGLGYIQDNILVEADRSSIVGKVVGETEGRMIGHIADAMGGVLFIDEAYALAKEGNDFGKEAINVLIKAMEDYRDDFVVILAGYQSDMNDILQMNEGFRSRIPHTFKFKDYTPEELTDIAVVSLLDDGYDCAEIIEDLKEIITGKFKKGEVVGNGRWVRNFVDKMVKEHDIRVDEEVNEENIGKILLSDIYLAAELDKSKYSESNEHLKEEAFKQLEGLIGLDDLKNEIKDFFDFVEVEKQRESLGYSSEKLNMHMLLLGSPGTGKPLWHESLDLF